MDGKKISAYSCSSELRYFWGNNISGIGTICHELGYVLGASDFYDTNRDAGGQFEGTGQWDLMAQGSWNGGEDIPAHHNPYTKTQIYNWATAQSVPADNTLVNLSSANSNSNSFYKINTTTSGEYFLVENRQQLGFDSALPGHGMMVYHVHSQIESDKQMINATFPQKFYPVCASATLNPNNNPISYGDINSFGCPFPGSSSKNAFTANTTPSAISWGGIETGKNLHFITEVGNNVSFVVSPLISGSSLICNQETYTINNLPTGATVTWSYSSNLQILSSGSNYTVLQSIGSGLGYVSATALIGSLHYTLPQQTVWLGVPNRPEMGDCNGLTPPGEPLRDCFTLCFNRSFTEDNTRYFHSDQRGNIIEWEWQKVSTNFDWGINGGNEINFRPRNTNSIITFKGRVRNACGWSQWNYFSLGVVSCEDVLYSIYPNPATNILTIELKASETSSDTESLSRTTSTTVEPYTIELWSEHYGLVRTVKSSKSSQQISLKGLPKGMYYVHLISDKKMIKKQTLWIK